jgi:predicted dehydrogenase
MSNDLPVKVGVIGTGNISSIYLKNSAWLRPIEIVAVADQRPKAAAAQATAFNIPHVYTVDELLADPTIEIVLNLTTPNAHGVVALAALNAGKSVYNEKPLTLTREEAQALLTMAQERGLRIGCAPDTFLGAGIQTCRHLIDSGAIGQPIAATAFMMGPGHESWHPNPAFYYQPGGGPMFDMGPYYLTALVSLLGSVTAVSGMVTKGQAQRTITSQPLAGEVIEVQVPTHVAGLLSFANGAVGTIVTSFDVQGHEHPYIEIYGTTGTLSVPDPNTFGGSVRLKRAGADWETMPHSHAYPENSRGLGLADMAAALRNGKRPHRANGEMAYHVLDLMWAFHDAAAQGQQVSLQSSCARPEPLSSEPIFGELLAEHE